jgi:hypothetical protein
MRCNYEKLPSLDSIGSRVHFSTIWLLFNIYWSNLMDSYTIEDLFQSINDIYLQLDEGAVDLKTANEITANCCKAFLDQLQGE